MKTNITINITNNGGTVNVYTSNPIPYKSVTDKEGLLHTFYSKEDYEGFITELQEKNK